MLLDKLLLQTAAVAKTWGLDMNDGTAQLTGKPATKYEQQLIDRATAYGRMRALEDLHDQINEGRL